MLPRMIFDFIEGGAGRELAVARNQNRFDEILLQPRVLEDVSVRSLETSFLNYSFDVPFGIAPMGMCNLVHHNADKIMCEVARTKNLPFCVSSASSTNLETVRNDTGDNSWFQLYMGNSLEHYMSLIDRAKKAGYQTLVLTADVPQVSRRTRDLRNGFKVPFKIGLRQFIDFAMHPSWSLNKILHGTPRPQNYDSYEGVKFDRYASRAGLNWELLSQLRDTWQGNLIVKGITSPSDAQKIVSYGVDAIYVSNHGGRQLDSVPAAIDLLPTIRDMVGVEFPIVFDSGIRGGEDVLKALALGANFVMLGRPVLHAIGADGKKGLTSLFDAISEDISVGLSQLGLKTIQQINSSCVWPLSSHIGNISHSEQTENWLMSLPIKKEHA
jgi:isopentenyl diphosphate isomerase/L-lactate dehydrogenase-like FMN-dependent dehydrogenase